MDGITRAAIKDAVQQATTRQWKDYFEFLRQQQYQKIASAKPEELLNIQQQVIACNSMEFNLVELRKLDIDKNK